MRRIQQKKKEGKRLELVVGRVYDKVIIKQSLEALNAIISGGQMNFLNVLSKMGPSIQNEGFYSNSIISLIKL